MADQRPDLDAEDVEMMGQLAGMRSKLSDFLIARGPDGMSIDDCLPYNEARRLIAEAQKNLRLAGLVIHKAMKARR